MRVLNIGAGGIGMPPFYQHWEQVTLDINRAARPDILMDARHLARLPKGEFDAVYASHVLEHFHEHEIGGILAGFAHVLACNGFADIRVPDLAAAIRMAADRELGLTDTLYTSAAGPIRLADMLWGHQPQIAVSGQPYMAHKWGFTRSTFGAALQEHFAVVYVASRHLELHAYAFKEPPDAEVLEWLELEVK